METSGRFCYEQGNVFLEASSLSKVYRMGATEVHALRGVDFQAHQGDFVVINGPSGSGKTSLLNQLALIDRPSSGEVYVEGTPTGSLAEGRLAEIRKAKIGLIFQTFNLVPVLSAMENVEYPLLLQRIPRNDRRKRVLEMLTEVGLADLANRRPDQLSGGQRQRVAIARALVTEPKMVLADEPTANLDSETGARIMDQMSKLNEQHCVVFVVVTHDPAVSKYGSRHVQIHDGELIEPKREEAVYGIAPSSA